MYSRLVYTYFINIFFFAIFQTELAYIYYRYKFIVAKLTALQIYCAESKYFAPCISFSIYNFVKKN
jgi:hypothetical protein